MKKTLCSILISVLLFTLASCDRSHLCSLDVLCSNENASIVVDGEKVNSFNFSSEGFNHQPLENYSNIDFTNTESNVSNANVNKFEITSSTNDTYNLSLELVETNKYVVDFLRVGIIIDGELSVYKYYDKREELYHKENDPDSILHFNSKSEIFSELTVDFSAGETKEIVIFIWIEEAELYDKNGERYTGWADKSYNASPIMLSMEVK
ncbi:MAG: hypothetical protein J6V80_03560 [Clostridia bacterium]|nr:hypothetical protein [Clostridia bacterium]